MTERGGTAIALGCSSPGPQWLEVRHALPTTLHDTAAGYPGCSRSVSLVEVTNPWNQGAEVHNAMQASIIHVKYTGGHTRGTIVRLLLQCRRPGNVHEASLQVDTFNIIACQRSIIARAQLAHSAMAAPLLALHGRYSLQTTALPRLQAAGGCVQSVLCRQGPQ